MALSRPFLFDRQFDGGTSASAARGTVASERTPPKQFDENDLAAARADGVAQGHAQAQAEAETEDRRRLTVACEAIAARLAELFRETEAIGAAAAREATELAVAIARKLLPETCRRQGLTELEGVLADVMRHLQHQPRLTVAVHPSVAAVAAERTTALAAQCGYAGRIAVVADPSVGEDACTVDWIEGGAIRSPRTVWDEIDDIVARSIGGGVQRPEGSDAGAASDCCSQADG
jgi:flagellar assembly protein FliH